MDDSVEALNSDIVLKFKKFLVEQVENDIIVYGPQNLIYELFGTFGKGHGSNIEKAVINNISGVRSKVSDPNQGRGLSHGIHPGSLGMEIVNSLGCWCCFVAIFCPYWSYFVSMSTTTLTTLTFYLP